MRSFIAISWLLVSIGQGAQAQPLDFERPESWGMAYATAVTLFNGFGIRPEDEPWKIHIGADLGSIPSIDEEQRRVGFNGSKLEDLNKSPIFGRVWLRQHLPAGFAVELGWTPPVQLDGVRAHGIYALAVDKTLINGERWHLQARAFGQTGRAIGDITCSREVAAFGDDLTNNPFGCDAPSEDIVELDYYGAALTLGYVWERFTPFFSISTARIHPEVKIRAQVFGQPDNSRLTTEGTIESYSLGLLYRPSDQWELALGASHTPLDVRREFDGPTRSDALTSVRASLRLALR